MKDTVIAFVGSVVPDTKEYHIPGYTRAGNLAQIGFLDAFRGAGFAIDVVLSGQPIAYYPKNRTIFKRGRTVEIFPGLTIRLIPLVNLFLLRDLLRAVYIYGYLFFWSLRRLRFNRVIVTYNLNLPPVLPILLLSRLTGARLVPIIYDIAWPEGLSLGWIRNVVHKTLIKLAGACVPLLDGRIAITDAIAREYAPGRHFLRVDGGVTELIERRLFELEPTQDVGKLILCFAGGLDAWNHVNLMLETMRLYPGDDLELWLAGNGTRMDEVRAAAARDARIVCHGMLDLDGLFELYRKADILLNLRNTRDPAMRYHFPSKLLEILTVGKPVITTAIAHVEEEYGPYCYVLRDETPQGLTRLLNEIRSLSKEERLAVGARARAFMLREHTWRSQGMKIKAYLERDVLKGSP